MSLYILNCWKYRLPCFRFIAKYIFSPKCYSSAIIPEVNTTFQSIFPRHKFTRLCPLLYSSNSLFKKNGKRKGNIRFLSSAQNEDVNRILSEAESKFNTSKTISSTDIIQAMKELEAYKQFITDTELKRLITLTHAAVEQEFCPTGHLVERLLDILMIDKDFRCTHEEIAMLLAMCLRSSSHSKSKEILKLIAMNQKVAELLIANLCHLGDEEETKKTLSIMKLLNLSMSENIYSSLLTLKGNLGDVAGIQETLLQMQRSGIEMTVVSQSAAIVAFIRTKEWLKAKEIIDNVMDSEEKFTSAQYSNVVVSCAQNGTKEHLQYVLESKASLLGDIDTRKVMLQLIHSDFPALGIQMLLAEETYMKNTHVWDNGAIFIQELVRSKHDTSLVLELCHEIANASINAKTLQVALEAALTERRDDLSLALIRALKEKDEPLRVHYFWPLLARREGEQDIVGKTTAVLEEMQRLGVSPNPDTLKLFVIPNMKDVEPTVFFNMLFKVGVGKTKASNALLSDYIARGEFHAVKEYINKTEYVPFTMDDLIEPLVEAYHKGSAVQAVDAFNMFLFHWYKRTKKTDADWKQTFVQQILRASSDKSQLVDLEFLRKSFPDVSLEVPDLNKKVNRDEMSIQELECDLVELRSKNMRTRGVLRALLIKYAAAQNHEKMSQVLKELSECDAATGTDLTPGVKSALMYRDVKGWNPDAALEAYYSLRHDSPMFDIDPYKVIDLCTLLVSVNRVQDALSLMRDFTSSAKTGAFDRRNSFMKNCFRLLTECAKNAGYAHTKQMCTVLISGGVAEPSINILAPLIMARLHSKNLESVVDEAEDILRNFRVIPRRVEILTVLMKNRHKEAENVPALIDRMLKLIASYRGFVQSKHDLLQASVESGDPTEASRVLQEVENYLDDAFVKKIIHFWVRKENLSCLLTLLNMCRSPKIDRLHLCDAIVNVYRIHRNREDALALLSQMEEEGLTPSPDLLNKINNMTHSSNPRIPYDQSL